ncbi:dTDP-4-dehydrorhamnose reductase [Cloacibacterium normanense]|uniref:dTDP-4-dehydrorhamnose reductase n=1 Tax=Cloacibacterium normanense TaxID=237258 RepID=A0A1E5UBB2_9FLAO|nr:dTDP-4-dehydrorhamnose reductase [Cloacibacterium normanense]AZI70167.1 dTDP-4-dehydrorhamnose reductase [Cloacibacterium normanense]OEL10209.1 dTDP-4-dehydrorhamnose reductase [Cloacibacterium normanense]SDO32682.1 dTDP-4-dehydrorhamnose reductase [Cloacibacterium normanense]
MKKILVTGANGQLGQCLQKISSQFEEFEFIFTDSETLDITNKEEVNDFFWQNAPDFCINAAAYTAVDLAETDIEKAFLVNADGTENLAEACAENNAQFIHVSTDYVFDGENNLAYTEEDFTNPLGVYGASKLAGDELALEVNPCSVILRTSWVYSEFGKNFVKTMLNLFATKDELNIVADQFGQPTNANDLAEAIMKIIKSEKITPGIFNFSNLGRISWFDFAEKIAELSEAKIKLNAIETSQYPTPAKRPKNSVLDLDKISKTYGIQLKPWEESLEGCVQILQNN